MPLYSTPASRWPYDLDGTVGFLYDGSTVTTLSSATLTALNQEKAGAGLVVPAGGAFGLLFPRDSAGNQLFPYCQSCLAFGSGGSFQTQITSNSVNGNDGSWSAISSGTPGLISSSPPDPVIRTNTPSGFGATQASGVRLSAAFGAGFTLQAFHLFAQGMSTGGASVIAFSPGKWLLSSSDGHDGARTFDFGDTLRGGTYTKTCYFVNPSTTQTANSVVLSFDSPTGVDTAGLAEHQVKVGAGAYGSTATISSIAPGGTSPQITIKRTVGGAALTGPWVYRLLATVGSWT